MKLIPYSCKILVKQDTSEDPCISINSLAIEPVEMKFGIGLRCNKKAKRFHIWLKSILLEASGHPDSYREPAAIL